MLGGLLKRVFGSVNDRTVAGLRKRVDAINALEEQISALDDEALKAKTDEFRSRLNNGETLDDILEEAFAVVREAAKRTLGMRHFDVQLIGGMVLHSGKIAEMKTGEGKTLVATLPVYLNALDGKGAHVVTVNDYLARRDAGWMGNVYTFLGLTVGVIVPQMPEQMRKQQYACDITYATNNELGFDYLRDNLKFRLEDMAQREPNFAIVDEVDSILIDEARTPLIISGPSEDSSGLYRQINEVIPKLTEADYEKDEKSKAISLTEDGQENVENILRDAGVLEDGNLYDIQNVSLVHHVNQALRAHKMFTADVDYVVKDDKIIIVDEFTGRLQEGRRYSDGLHQALEAKEGVKVQNENQTIASVTFQNYFRMYNKLAGMTGTAMTEAAEFEEIYGLEVIEIPTNKDMVRIDNDDEVYRSAREKEAAGIEQIKICHEKGQPVLVGTISIERSEQISKTLTQMKIPHKVLNARHHEQEAHIISDAGVPGAVTIATNMAGRGTDIQLGGNLEMRVERETQGMEDQAAIDAKVAEITADIEAKKKQVLDAGGLFVLGTERHESRRIDNQLRGRSGRQGDPGESKFYVSLEDDLMRIFGSERMDGMLQKLGLEDGEAIIHPWVNKALEKAQQKVEARNFEIRKQLLKFDDVMNDQRKVIFEQRKELMRADDVHDTVLDMRYEVIDDIVDKAMPKDALPDQWSIDSMHEETLRIFGLNLPVQEWAKEEGIADQEIRERLREAVDQKMAKKAVDMGTEMMRYAERGLLLQLLDTAWKDHLLNLDHLRQGIGLRAYGQRDPLNEYKSEAFELFESMLDNLRSTVTQVLSHVEIRADQAQQALEPEAPTDLEESGPSDEEDAPATAVRSMGTQYTKDTAPPGFIFHEGLRRWLHPNDPETWGKVSRNSVCPCGSGKKYKHCHGNL
ncbi:preprotein translocase subunit SecA [Hwanghaeella grinnelliae]|uniref:Protein translocase subunit SecA n=1 Tax=Hwanghaeella grinnelliae TaxID=2500179 RepID=A0A3S2VPG8_9PROT|nr:preprotein translocase subunit SecA [Hwanghaeella grinnelliae]RVU35875.1 preprotein translocase subunit SecA [Hwanghaeella grinnelliae]